MLIIMVLTDILEARILKRNRPIQNSEFSCYRSIHQYVGVCAAGQSHVRM